MRNYLVGLLLAIASCGAGADGITTPGGGSVSIGAAIGSGTAASVLFVCTGPVFCQDNANFNYSATGGVGSTPLLTVLGALKLSAGGYVGLGQSAILGGAATPTWAISSSGNSMYLQSTTQLYIGGYVSASTPYTFNTGAVGGGLLISPGTAASTLHALAVTQTTTTGGDGARLFSGIHVIGATAAATTSFFIDQQGTSHAGSLLMDLQTASASKFAVTKAGLVLPGNTSGVNVQADGATTGNGMGSRTSGFGIVNFYSGGGNPRLEIAANLLTVRALGVLSWSSNTDVQDNDTAISKISPALVAIGANSTSGDFGGSLKFTNFEAVGTGKIRALSTLVDGADGTNTSGYKFVSFVSNSAEAGNVIRVAQTAAVVFTTSSSGEYKNILGDSDRGAASDRIMAYKMRDYEWKSQPGTLFNGPIAEEAYAVNPDPMLFPGGNKTINMSGFVPDLIMTAQSLEARIKRLEAANDSTYLMRSNHD